MASNLTSGSAAPSRPARRKSKGRIRPHPSFRALPPLPPPPPPPPAPPPPTPSGSVCITTCNQSRIIFSNAKTEVQAEDASKPGNSRDHRKVVKLRSSHECRPTSSFLQFRYHCDKKETFNANGDRDHQVQEISVWVEDDEFVTGAILNIPIRCQKPV